jgi:hypothetical protein
MLLKGGLFMPESKLDPVITVDVTAAVKESKVTAKVDPKTVATHLTQPTQPALPPVVQPEVSKTTAIVSSPVVEPKKKIAKPSKVVKAQKAGRKIRAQKGAVKANAKPDSYMHFGDYFIHVRPNSAYSLLYKILAEEVDFISVCKQLDAFEGSDEKACAALLRGIFVDRDHFEKRMRTDPSFIEYCKAKTERIKDQAARGISEAKKVLKNEKRFRNGLWYGNIREMISVCCGSTSPEADNRNMKKYLNAKICFRQFPRVSRGNSKVYLSMFPSKNASKVNKAIKVVFGDEKREGFGDYLETKVKQVFGS